MSNQVVYRGSSPTGLLCVLLTVLFVALKLTGVIAWSWLWVLAPLWIPFALGILILICVVIFIAIVDR